jgi:hypothetical protein
MKERERKLKHKFLVSVLDYDPETGKFKWKKVTSNRAVVGREPGFVDKNGARCISVLSTRYLAHRLAWFYVHKKWPKAEIDHINGIPSDNRLANLREASKFQNTQNSRIRSHNTTGYKGIVKYQHDKNRFVAVIRAFNKVHHLGIFDTPLEAHLAYVEASKIYHKEFRRTH